MGGRWGTEGPPDEAYSRVTNPERFTPLHDAAGEALDRLEAQFDVTQVEGVDIDRELEWDSARPTVQLTPRAPEAGKLAIGFTPFPGLVVRLGHWLVEPIPVCGCDACDETAEEGGARLGQLVNALRSGHHPGAHTRPCPRRRLVRVCDASEDSRSRMPRERARALIEAADGRSWFDYAPWSPRVGGDDFGPPGESDT
jgi:hypothetical protein